jgi:tRNA A-37 threonylcarbamoyl transferase component Bud32
MQTNATHALPLQELHSKTQQVRDWRVKDYLKKTARDCSLFSVRKNSRGITAVQRSYVAEIEPLLANPDQFIEQGHIYKTGGAATVARVEQGNKSWIIKRYNIKNMAHWLKRCWRPTRAWHSWQAAHRLQQLEIPVANTIAVKEQRTLGLRRTAWLITEYCGEQDLIARFQPYIDNAQVPEADLTALQLLLNSMIREKISHGDLKGHNILWHNDRCLLIDLDAVRAHSSPRSFVRAFSRDRARLLRNWPQESPLYKLLDQHLPQLLDN